MYLVIECVIYVIFSTLMTFAVCVLAENRAKEAESKSK